MEAELKTTLTTNLHGTFPVCLKDIDGSNRVSSLAAGGADGLHGFHSIYCHLGKEIALRSKDFGRH